MMKSLKDYKRRAQYIKDCREGRRGIRGRIMFGGYKKEQSPITQQQFEELISVCENPPPNQEIVIGIDQLMFIRRMSNFKL